VPGGTGPVGDTGPVPDRRRSSTLVTGLVVVLAIVAVAVVAGTWFRGRPSALDRFYELPDRGVVVAAERGQVLREEPMDNAGTGAVAYRVLYRTVGVGDAPVAASGFVAWPSAEAPPGGYPIVALGHSTVGLADGCAPSREGLGEVNRAQAVAFLEAGFAVAAADFPGLGPEGPHPYLVGEPTAASVIDVVRAARRSAGDQLGARVVGWGYSQGGHAVLWARARVATEAPELDWRATVALAPVIDPARLVAAPGLGPVLAVAVAMGQATRGLDVEPLLTEAGREGRDDLERECVADALGDATERDGPVLVEGERGWLEDLAREVPPVAGAGPALVLYGDRDDTIDPAVVGAWVAEGAGAGVEGQVLPGRGHGGLEADTAPRSIEWLRARLAG